MRTRHSHLQRLRQAIDCLPARTRGAMLEGIDSHDIVVGAYTTRDGGVCPMLAAHRGGGRTDLLSFARAWDRYTAPGRRSRRATKRELGVLRFQLQASLLAEEHVDLCAAIAEHRAACERSMASRRAPVSPARPGDSHRAPELQGRWGWAWLRPLRRLDDYEQALRLLEQQETGTPAGASLQPGPAVTVVR